MDFFFVWLAIFIFSLLLSPLFLLNVGSLILPSDVIDSPAALCC